MNQAKTAAIIIGAKGGIGSAIVDQLEHDPEIDIIFGVTRYVNAEKAKKNKKLIWLQSDESEQSIQSVSSQILREKVTLRFIIIASGVLHDPVREIKPEKRIDDLQYKNLHYVFNTNTFMPLIWIKELQKTFKISEPTTIAVLSARVGSISDNHLGGWYAYRASKSALNMLLKCLAIELSRRYPKTKLISFHPGTTNTKLSKPYQKGLAPERIFTTDFVAERLYLLLKESTADGVLSFKDWDHQDIDW